MNIFLFIDFYKVFGLNPMSHTCTLQDVFKRSNNFLLLFSVVVSGCWSGPSFSNKSRYNFNKKKKTIERNIFVILIAK